MIYRQTDQKLLPDASAFNQVVEWMPFDNAKGICAIGKPRVGKTRAMWKLMYKLFVNHRLRVRPWESGAWVEWATEKTRDGTLHSNLVEICNSSCCVFIDDCWKNGMTTAQEWALWDLMEVASSRGCAIHMTTNASGKDLINQAQGESETLRIRPMLARVREFCQVIQFGKDE